MTMLNELMNGLDFKMLGKRAWQGAAIGFVLLATWILLLIAKGEDFAGWIVLPFVTVSIGGAGGGIFYYVVSHLWPAEGLKKVLLNVITAVVYFATLWLSLIAALNLTGQWN